MQNKRGELMKIKLITTTLLCASFTISANKIDIAQQAAQADLQQQLASQNANKGVVNFATVANSGPDVNDCDFRIGGTVIQDAIDDANNYEEIRIVSGTYPENLTLTNRDITIKGGYASCADAINDIVTLNDQAVDTIVEPVQPTSNPALAIIGNDATRNTVNITNMHFTGGVDNFLLTAGGISTFADDLQLNLTHVWIQGNEGLLGGGLAIVGGNTDVYARNLMVIGNTADQGGGIFCTGTEASIVIDYNNPLTDRFGIYANTATDVDDGNGGGALIDSGCSLSHYVGTSTPTLSLPFDIRGFILNFAAQNGGAVAVTNGGRAGLYGYQFCFIGCYGDNDNPVTLLGNEADNDENSDGAGGALYASGADSALYLSNSWTYANSAFQGGAIALRDTATADVNAVYENFFFATELPCWSEGSCNQIDANTADNTGGAFDIRTGGVATVNRTHITGNRTDVGTGAYVNGADSTLIMESSLMANNGEGGSVDFNDNWLIRVFGGAVVEIAFSTLADNDVNNTVLVNASSTMRVGSSIVHQLAGPDVYASDTPVTEIFDCVMAHEIGSLSGGVLLAADDPEFVDRNNGDYHLNEAISPAVDYCDDFTTVPTIKDIDNQPRPWDWSNIGNNAGPYDLGFDETTDLIFYNGFEQLFTPL